MARMEINALVDTGAAYFLMAKQIFDRLCQHTKRPRLLQPAGLVCGFGEKNLDVLGETEIHVDRTGPVRVLVTAGLAHEVILGCDAIVRGHGQLDYKNNTLNWYGKTLKLHPYPDHQPYAAVNIWLTTGLDTIDGTLSDFDDVLGMKDDGLGECDLLPFNIDTGSTRPIRQRPYRTPLHKRSIIEEQLQDMLDNGVIQPSQSPWASPITLVPKKDGTLRFCVDYRKLNAVTKKDAYPLPLIQDIFDQLEGAQLFSTLDLKSGYWQIPVATEDRHKTAFVCHAGQFEFRQMPFGAANAPAVFQRTMDHILHGLIGKFCFVYINDIVIYSRNPQEHASHLQAVLQRLREAGLRTKLSKCHFAQQEIKLLGYLVNEHGIRSDPEKTKAIANMRPPTRVTEVRSFLGMTGYYRQTIPDYAHIAAPLTALARKHVRWEWTAQCEQSFRTLQQQLQSDSALAFTRTDRPYQLFTDACDYAVGGILVQKGDDGIDRVVQYMYVSHQLPEQQRKWATIEKEAYAIVYCLNKLRQYLWGAEFEILMDHKPLKCLFQGEMATTKIQRWGVLIAEFGAPIRYKEGRKNVRADMLSRIRPMEVDAVDTANWIEPQADEVEWTLPLQFDGIDPKNLVRVQKTEFPNHWQEAQDEDNEDYEVRESILYSCRRPGPRQAAYRRVLLPALWHSPVIERCHQQTGHAGIWKTMRAIQECYVWPGMKKDVTQHLRSCAVCQIHKPTPQHVAHGRMPDPRYPHQIVSMYLTGPLTRSERGHAYLFTLIDHLTGWADAYPISNKKGETIADILHRDYFPRYGAPEILISDNGTEFVNSSVAALCKACDVERRMTTPYHPQSNGKIERFHRTLKGIIERLMTKTRANWESQLGPALSAYRNTVSSATGYTPFQALYGRQVRIPTSVAVQNATPGEPLADDRVAALARIWQGARTMLRQECETNENLQNRKALSEPLHTGDAVIVLYPGMHPSFQPRWDARWEIIHAKDPVYWIRHLPSGREKVIHREKLRRVPSDIDWAMAPRTLNGADPLTEPAALLNASELQATPTDTLGGVTAEPTDHDRLQECTPVPNAEAMETDESLQETAEPRRNPARKRRTPQHLACYTGYKCGRFASVDWLP